MVRTIVFDLGGVIITLHHARAVRRFEELGIKDAARQLDPYTQGGPFGALEQGHITMEEFRQEMCRQTGREVSSDECAHAWMGYMGEVPAVKLDMLEELRLKGYRLVLLSNTNPFVAQWFESPAFDGRGNGLAHYFDAEYMSFELGVMKPDARRRQGTTSRTAQAPRALQ